MGGPRCCTPPPPAGGPAAPAAAPPACQHWPATCWGGAGRGGWAGRPAAPRCCCSHGGEQRTDDSCCGHCRQLQQLRGSHTTARYCTLPWPGVEHSGTGEQGRFPALSTYCHIVSHGLGVAVQLAGQVTGWPGRGHCLARHSYCLARAHYPVTSHCFLCSRCFPVLPVLTAVWPTKNLLVRPPYCGADYLLFVFSLGSQELPGGQTRWQMVFTGG